MRTRRFMAVFLGCVLVLLGGCGGKEAGPPPARQPQDPGPDALPIKLAALTADQCFLAPDQQVAKGCEKYVTELGNTAASVRRRAGSKDPQLGALADQVDKSVSAYRTSACTTVSTRGNGLCAQALSDLARTLGAIGNAVNKPATTG